MFSHVLVLRHAYFTIVTANHGQNKQNNHQQPTVATEEPEIEAEEMTSPNPSSWTFGWPTSGFGRQT